MIKLSTPLIANPKETSLHNNILIMKWFVSLLSKYPSNASNTNRKKIDSNKDVYSSPPVCEMDSFYKALYKYRRRNYEECIDLCTNILEKQPLDQAAWCLKMKAMTQRVYIDDIETEDIMESDVFDENVVASAPRPGTSMKPSTAHPSTALRPKTTAGRPLSGVARPGTQARPGSALDRLKTARPLTAHSSRAIRLGTAAMLTQKDGVFIQVSRLNIPKYAKNAQLAKPLFKFLFYHENDVRTAMDLAVQATQFNEFNDWWWKMQLGKCYIALNLLRDGEQQLRSALKQFKHVELFLRLVRIYLRLDQPLSATEVCKSGLLIFPDDVCLLIELARLNEALGDLNNSVKFYKSVVIEDAMNTEAIASIAVYHFYNYQPELALRYYRRILAMGAHSAELYNNLGLCCLYAQQLDLVLVCFQRALELATDPLIKAEVWFNLSHIAIGCGDIELAIYCLNLCLSCDQNHAPAYNNLAVMQYKLGKTNIAKAYFTTAINIQEDLNEANKNIEFLQQISK